MEFSVKWENFPAERLYVFYAFTQDNSEVIEMAKKGMKRPEAENVCTQNAYSCKTDAHNNADCEHDKESCKKNATR